MSHKQNGSNWRIHTSANGGSTWENVTLSIAESNFNGDRPIYLDVDGEDPLRAYCILLGTQDDYIVYSTSNAGETWDNLTTSTLDDEYVVSIAHQGDKWRIILRNNKSRLFRDDSMNDWELYNSGLPMITAATFLQADYCGGNIRVADQGLFTKAHFIQILKSKLD